MAPTGEGASNISKLKITLAVLQLGGRKPFYKQRSWRLVDSLMAKSKRVNYKVFGATLWICLKRIRVVVVFYENE